MMKISPDEFSRDGAVNRRTVLRMLGLATGSLAAASCGGGGSGSSATTVSGSTTSTTDTSATASSSTATSDGMCILIPEETAGPYPSLSLIERSDITEGKSGVPLTLQLTVVNFDDACAPVEGLVVEIWHCDNDGVYSGYSQPGSNTVGQTFLRGYQLTDSNGVVTFTTIYPGWYSGRITHIHFRVYTNDELQVATSQLGFPQSVTTAVYNSELYRDHGQNTSVAGFSSDNVFSDGTEGQIASISGSVADGYVATLTVGVSSSYLYR